jgi:hypothetical protein
MDGWVSFFDRLPVAGQTIYYYGPDIGVWRGTYAYAPDDPVSHHMIHCGESPGVVDRMDAPWWQPFAGQDKPAAPNVPYPSDYPGGE